MKVQKRPIVVDASQFFPPEHPQHDPSHVVGCEVGMADIGTITLMTPDGSNRLYSIKTISGWAKIEPGDWIITGPQTESTPRDIYPCKEEVFKATYEIIGE